MVFVLTQATVILGTSLFAQLYFDIFLHILIIRQMTARSRPSRVS